MKKRLFSLILALLMTSSAFISCSDKDDETTENPNESESQNESESEAKETTWIDLLPSDIYYEDFSFNIGMSTPNDGMYTNECYIDPDDIEVGDIVAQAVYDRNLKTEDKLGIVIYAETFGNDWTDTQRAITNLTASGDNPYSVYDISVTMSVNCAAAGLFADLNGVITLDLDNEWWDQVTREMYSLGSKNLFFINGDINYYDDYATKAIFYDQALAEEFELENVYDLVRSGKWTFDKFIELCQAVEMMGPDGYGDGTDGHTFGYVGMNNIIPFFMSGFGENIILINDEGEFSLNQTERCYDLVDLIFTKLTGAGVNYTSLQGNNGDGEYLFTTMQINEVAGLRSREDIYGFVPYPKYDETQEKYYNQIELPWATVYSIPFDSKNIDQCGYILDVMGYYSQDTVYEAVIENSIYVKGIRNPDTAEMLDIIFNSRFFELALAGTNIYNGLMDMVGTGTNTYASVAKRFDKITKNAFKNISENFQYE